MYPCITEAEVCDLEKKLGCAIPEVYRNFLMNVSNGFDIMNCTLALHGCRTSYNRSDLDSWYPFSLEDIQKNERPKNATQEMFFLLLIIMTVQSFILIHRIIRYTTVTVTTRLH